MLTISLLQFFDRYILTPNNRYHLSARLRGHQAGVGCVAFDEKCRIVVSGGDDEVVKIWNLQSSECLQTLSDQASQWGQITSLAFSSAGVGRSLYLFIGTGRGRLVVYQRNSMSPLFMQIFDQEIFTNFDCVESMHFSASKQRLVATSQSGKIKLFRFSAGQVSELWEQTLKGAIPRGCLFAEKGEEVQIYGLETGEVAIYDTETAEKKGMRILKSRIGGVSICNQSGKILVDNLGTGFDLYLPNKSQPTRSYSIPAKRVFVKQAVFGELGELVVCGSDHGIVYTFGADAGNGIQKLLIGTREDRIPVVETGYSAGYHFIATASRGKCNEVTLWKKPIIRIARRRSTRMRGGLAMLINVLLLLAFAWYSADSWMPIVTSHALTVGTSVSSFIDGVALAFDQQDDVALASDLRNSVRHDMATSQWNEAHLYSDDEEAAEDWDEDEIDTL